MNDYNHILLPIAIILVIILLVIMFTIHRKRHPQTSVWVNYNANPLDEHTTDCVIRATAKLLDVDWYGAFDLLAKLARELCCNIDCEYIIYTLLYCNGFSPIHPRKDDITFADFARHHTKGRFMLFSKISGFESGHVVAVIDGKIYDHFDSGNYRLSYALGRYPHIKHKILTEKPQHQS